VVWVLLATGQIVIVQPSQILLHLQFLLLRLLIQLAFDLVDLSLENVATFGQFLDPHLLVFEFEAVAHNLVLQRLAFLLSFEF
jgi:hypothetical protein